MKKSKFIFLLFAPSLIFLLMELIRVFIRPVYGQMKYGLLSDILGWLPNFLSSIAFMLFCVLILILLINQARIKFSKRALSLLLIGFTLLGLSGFILHEINQDGKRLFFDLSDIYATIAGIVVGDLLYFTFLLKDNLSDLVVISTKPNITKGLK